MVFGVIAPKVGPGTDPGFDETADFERLMAVGEDVFDETLVPTTDDLATVDLGSIADANAAWDADNPVGAYLREVGRAPLLSHDEEVELGMALDAGKKALAVLRRGDYHPQDEAAFRTIVANGKAAFDRFVRSNMRLVVSNAGKYKNRGLDFLDLIQDGNIGLIKAIGKYDYLSGYRFATYATWWIRQAMQRSIETNSTIIRRPTHFYERLRLVTRTQKEFTQTHHREPTLDELAAETGLSVAQIEFVQDKARDVQSLDVPSISDDESDATLANFIPSSAPGPEEVGDMSELADQIVAVLQSAGLTELELQVLAYRFGFNGERLTLEETGARLGGRTKEAIRKTERAALRKCRALKHLKVLAQYRELV